MNNLNHTLRKFNRFELKYLVTLQQAERFNTALRAYLLPDDHGNQNGRYALTSLYYDSPDLRCFWEKEAGVRVRRKLRMRRYENGEVLTEETPIFVEIKQRSDSVTQKRRVLLPYGEALRLCNDRQMPDHDPEDQATIEEIYAFVWQYNLRPVCIVRYERQAFMGTEYDIGLRVTFDTALSFQTYPLHLHDQPSGLPMLPGNMAVMEIKVNERIPTWLTDMIAAHNLQKATVSKYCRSIEAAQKMGWLRWQAQPVESAQEILASTLSVFSPQEQKVEVRRK